MNRPELTVVIHWSTVPGYQGSASRHRIRRPRIETQKVITGAGDWEGVRSLPSGLDGLGERRRMFPQLGREKNTGRKRILVNF